MSPRRSEPGRWRVRRWNFPVNKPWVASLSLTNMRVFHTHTEAIAWADRQARSDARSKIEATEGQP